MSDSTGGTGTRRSVARLWIQGLLPLALLAVLTAVFIRFGPLGVFRAAFPPLEDLTIEIAPLAYMRGRTLSDAFVILDEAQNSTTLQMKMFLTRLGMNSKVVITGDKTQIDLPRKEDSGLLQVETLLSGVDGIEFIYLDDTDVLRHRLVKDIIRAYARADSEVDS